MTAMAYVWLALAIVMGIVEGVTYALVSVWFAGGAVAAFAAALLGAGIPAQLGIFVVVSAILLACLRPLARRRAAVKPEPTNADRILGMEAVVTEAIDNVAARGAVKVGGVEWTARSEGGAPIAAGTKVKILRISGVKVFVEPAEVPATV